MIYSELIWYFRNKHFLNSTLLQMQIQSSPYTLSSNIDFTISNLPPLSVIVFPHQICISGSCLILVILRWTLIWLFSDNKIGIRILVLNHLAFGIIEGYVTGFFLFGQFIIESDLLLTFGIFILIGVIFFLSFLKFWFTVRFTPLDRLKLFLNVVHNISLDTNNI